MPSHNHNFTPFGKAIQVSVPSSYDYLPKPRLPTQRRIDEVAALQRSIINQVGLRPGNYTSLGNELFGQVEAVLSHLSKNLINALLGLDAVDLCKRLYQRHEELLGNILKAKQESVPHILLHGDTRPTEQRMLVWERVSLYTESIRWLIEVAVKYCKSPGVTAGNAKLEYLIELARFIYEWDLTWEYIAHNVCPYEVTIHKDFSMTSRPTRKGLKAWNAYRKASKSYFVESDREYAASVRMPQERVELDQVFELPAFKVLNGPLEEERGYRLTDWVRFLWGLIDSFGPTQYLKLTKVSKISRQLSRSGDLLPDRLENMLADHAITKEALIGIPFSELRPSEFARRDTRLLRRPIVLPFHSEKRLCLYGVDTLTASANLFLELLTSGRIRIPNVLQSGPLKRAIGRLQTSLGDMLRDSIVESCAKEGFQVEKEKERVLGERIPQGSGFGPVDVFVVDRPKHRFILVEAKNTADTGTVPRLMRDERKEYLLALEKQKKQIGWFENRLDSLKVEFGIPSDVAYSVEGVVVINGPRIWIYAHHNPLPIVHEKAFFRTLKRGGRFQTDPAAI